MCIYSHSEEEASVNQCVLNQYLGWMCLWYLIVFHTNVQLVRISNSHAAEISLDDLDWPVEAGLNALWRAAKRITLVPPFLSTTQKHYGMEGWFLGGVQHLALPVSWTADLTSFVCVYVCVFKSFCVCWLLLGSQLRLKLDQSGASEKLFSSLLSLWGRVCVSLK